VVSVYQREQRTVFNDRHLIARRAKLEGAESRLAETGNLDISALWKVTHQRLDYYHDIVTGQARQSFRNAQLAMGTGLLILIASSIAVVLAKTTTSSIVAGSLGGLGTTLASYIGRTFIRSQESAAEHLRAYFDQPLEFSRYLAAERLLTTIKLSDRPAVAGEIIQAIVGKSK
jgi:hypothetical protein